MPLFRRQTNGTAPVLELPNAGGQTPQQGQNGQPVQDQEGQRREQEEKQRQQEAARRQQEEEQRRQQEAAQKQQEEQKKQQEEQQKQQAEQQKQQEEQQKQQAEQQAKQREFWDNKVYSSSTDSLQKKSRTKPLKLKQSLKVCVSLSSAPVAKAA
jgi:membrane protein involved in colicin uptake